MSRMPHQTIPSSTYSTVAGPGVDRPRSLRDGLQRITFLFALLLSLTGCGALVGGLSEQELARVNAGETTIVLLRLECTAGGQPCEPFPCLPGDYSSNVTFGLGSFETAGEPQEITTRFLSEESAAMGWTFFVLKPGLYYLAVLPPRQTDLYSYQQMLLEFPRWKIDIPKNIKLMYVGTLPIEGEVVKLPFGMKTDIFGRDIKRGLTSIISVEKTVQDDHELAVSLQRVYFPDLGPINTALMERWQQGDPVILRTPAIPSRAIKMYEWSIYIKPDVTQRDPVLPRQTQVQITDLRKEKGFQRTAAFGVSMGRISLDRTVPELVSTMIETKSDETLARQGASQPEEITCEIRAFEIATPGTLLYWDVNTRIELLLRLRGQEREVSATATERTYFWPSEKLITRVVNEALRQAEEQSERALQELLALPRGEER